MAEVVRKRWAAQFHGMSRRDRGGCSYDAYLPDPIAGWIFTLPSDIAADIADAEAAIASLNRDGTSHVSLEGLARFLLRAESVASSRIEGLHAGPRRLVEAEATLSQRGNTPDRVAVEVLGNIAAMELAVDLASQKESISLADVLEIHRVLMDRSANAELGGVVRENRTGLVVVRITLAPPSTSLHRPNMSITCYATSWTTRMAMRIRRLCRLRWLTPSSRRSIHSPTVMAVPAER